MLDLFQYRAWALSETYLDRMYPVLLDAIKLGHDLVNKRTIEDFYPRMDALLALALIEAAEADSKLELKFESDQQSGLRTVRVAGKNIALLPVIGPLTKYSNLCAMGMQEIQAYIHRANASANVDGLVLIMDTPGGSVDGTQELGQSIFASAKPIGVFGDHQVCSAGMWLASQAKVIVGNKNNATIFGSIGVIAGIPNYQNMMAAGNHPNVKLYRSKQSPNKAKVNSFETISEEDEEQLQAELSEICSLFISTVKSGRAGKLDLKYPGLFDGSTFNVQRSKQNGLIDTPGTLLTALNKVAELAKQKKKAEESSDPGPQIQSESNEPQAQENTDMSFKSKLFSLFGKSEKAENKPADNQAALEAADNQAVQMEAEIATLRADKDAATLKVGGLEKTISEQTTQIADLQKQVADQKEELEKKATGNPTTIIPNASQESRQAGDQGATQSEKSKYRTSADDEADQYVNAMHGIKNDKK